MAIAGKGRETGRESRRPGVRRSAGLFPILALLAAAVPAEAAGGDALELERALPLDGPVLAQPSGLAWDGKRLLMVCAVHDDAIYAVEPQGDKAVFKEAIVIRRPKDAEGRKLAWRGIAAGKDGELYLASEQACRILKVEPDGDAEWIGPGLLEAGAEKGLFAGENSGLEGIAPVGTKRFLLAAAREPRGLLDADLSGKSPEVTAWPVDKTLLPLPTGRRKPDFADLAAGDEGRIWALCANSDALCQVKWTGSGYAEGEHWTYAHVANDPQYRYAGLRMGLGRGLALAPQRVFVALDNKGVGRQAAPDDKRPLLLVFKRPRGM